MKKKLDLKNDDLPLNEVTREFLEESKVSKFCLNDYVRLIPVYDIEKDIKTVTVGENKKIVKIDKTTNRFIIPLFNIEGKGKNKQDAMKDLWKSEWYLFCTLMFKCANYTGNIVDEKDMKQKEKIEIAKMFDNRVMGTVIEVDRVKNEYLFVKPEFIGIRHIQDVLMVRDDATDSFVCMATMGIGITNPDAILLGKNK